MSIEAVGWALNVPLSGNQKVILIGLANHAHPDGTEAYPSLDTLARYACCDRSTARRNVRKLVADGWAIEDGAGPRGQTKYRLPLDRGGLQNATPSHSATGGIAAAGGVANRANGGGIAVPPEPSFNRPGEPSRHGTKRAHEREALPEGFPEELRPHLVSVYRVLRDVSVRHEAREVKAVSLASVVIARARKPLVKAAHDFAAWADGQARRQRDVVAAYRNWLDREDDLAVVERLDEQGLPAGRVNGRNGNGSGLLKSARYSRGRSWDELTPREQAVARERFALTGQAGVVERDAAPIVPSGKSVNGASLAAEIRAGRD